MEGLKELKELKEHFEAKKSTATFIVDIHQNHQHQHLTVLAVENVFVDNHIKCDFKLTETKRAAITLHICHDRHTLHLPLQIRVMDQQPDPIVIRAVDLQLSPVDLPLALIHCSFEVFHFNKQPSCDVLLFIIVN